MDSLADALSHRDYPQALSIASSASIEPSFVHKHILFNRSPAEPFSLESLQVVLVEDPIWVARLIAHSLDQTPSSKKSATYEDEKALVAIFSQATSAWLDLVSPSDFSLRALLNQTAENDADSIVSRVQALIKDNEEVGEACWARWLAIERESKWKLYNEIYKSGDTHPSTVAARADVEDDDVEEMAWGELELGPLEDLERASGPESSFDSFCSASLPQLAHALASTLQLQRLRRLLAAADVPLDPLKLFDSIPLHARPSDLDYGQDLIALLPRPQSQRRSANLPINIFTLLFGPRRRSEASPPTDDQLTSWYLARVKAIDKSTGCIDTAIEIVQHGAGSGVVGLELIAEDLSLLGKLLYDAPLQVGECDWTLEEWTAKSTDEVVEAYLAGSTPQSLIKDIHQLVLPYLGVVESRRARASAPGAELTIPDALRTWALKQANNLLLLAALVKASSPSLKLPERAIKDNEELARIVIACLYTSPAVDEWKYMGEMFECMPAFPDTSPAPDDFSPATFLHSLLGRSRTLIWSPEGTKVVYDALLSLNTGCLSAILDGLDDHLTTAEVLARWNVPARLADLLIKFHGNKSEQEKLATRVARQEGGLEMESEEEWEVLLEAMVDLSQPGRALDLLEKTEVIKLFFSGLLTSGKFKLAKALFSPSSGERPLDVATQEELVIAASREFYDNAESGNLHTGEMKMAYDCLAAGPQTAAIRRERDFIEATSRLASFKLESQPGVLLSPIEVRLRPNKLDLIKRVLDTSKSAYQHHEMIIDLINKLGYGEDLLVQIKSLAAMVECAIREADLSTGTATCERMLSTLETMKKRPRQSEPWTKVEEASGVIWKTCERLGTCRALGEEQSTRGLKAKFLAHAVLICPAEEIPRLLRDWRKVEAEDEGRWVSLEGESAPKSTLMRGSWRLGEAEKARSESPMLSAVNLSGELASRTLGKAAALFPFRARTLPTGQGPQSRSSTPSTHEQPGRKQSADQSPRLPASEDHEEVGTNISQPLASLVRDDLGFAVGADRLTAALSNKFTSGVGWLIGANEENE